MSDPLELFVTGMIERFGARAHTVALNQATLAVGREGGVREIWEAVAASIAETIIIS